MPSESKKVYSARIRALFVLAATCGSFVALAHSQCPQPLAYATYSCKVGNCTGMVSLYRCDTSDFSSPDQCVPYTQLCCGKDTGYPSVNYGAVCPRGCSSLQPRLPSPRPVTVIKQRSDRGVTDGGEQRKEAKLLDPEKNKSDKEGR